MQEARCGVSEDRNGGCGGVGGGWLVFFFFFNDTATTEIYTLSLHDALPIFTLALSLDALCLREYMLGDMVYPYCRHYVTKVADKVHG